MTFAGMVRASMVDYPGHVAVTLFTAGCNLRCPYCHNPALVVGPPSGRPLPGSEALAFLARRCEFLSHLCITGGEPTVHYDLPDFLAAAKALGYAVKLDTNGWRPEVLEALLARDLVDYVAMDVKTRWERYGELGGAFTDPDRYRRSAGVIRAGARDYEFRTTVAPGLVARGDVLAIARDLAGARRYALQQFVAQGRQLLDPSWASVSPYPPRTLRAWAQEIAPFFEEPVQVRNIASDVGRALPVSPPRDEGTAPARRPSPVASSDSMF